MIGLRHHPDGCVYPSMRAPHWEWTTQPPDEAYTMEVDGVPASIVRLFHRRLIGNAVAFNVVGIGGSFTEPQFRNQRLASRLIGAVCSQWERRAMLAAITYATPENGRFVERLGFVRVQPYLYARSLAPGLAFEAETPQAPTNWWRVEPEGRF